MRCCLVEDHYEAFPFWREAGLEGLTCVHVDAHLDVNDDGFTPESLAAISRARSAAELHAFRGNPELPWGGFHCGNYLFPALRDGTVTHLVWVIPPHIVKGPSLLDWLRAELQNWVDLSLDEYTGLAPAGPRVEGSLAGRRFTVCYADDLPPLKQPLVLDIDVDYFVTDSDQIWQSPYELRESLQHLDPVALSVAWSVDGGYTPLEHRFLGQVTVSAFVDRDERWRDAVERIRQADAGEETLDELLAEPWPPWLTAALHVRRGLRLKEEPDGPSFQTARELCPEYRLTPGNLAARQMHLKRFDQALQWLDRCGEEGRYVDALVSLHMGDDARTAARLEQLMATELAPLEQSKVLALLAECRLRQGSPKEAAAGYKRAVALEPDKAHYLHRHALCLQALGDHRQAARLLRKALRLAGDRLSSLEMHLDLARLYQQAGNSTLAQAEHRLLQSKDVTGRLAMQSILESSLP